MCEDFTVVVGQGEAYFKDMPVLSPWKCSLFYDEINIFMKNIIKRQLLVIVLK